VVESKLGQGKLAKGETDNLREREPGPAARQNAAPAQPATIGDNAAPAARKWPLGLSLLIAAAVSIILWAGIIAAGIRLWRWF